MQPCSSHTPPGRTFGHTAPFRKSDVTCSFLRLQPVTRNVECVYFFRELLPLFCDLEPVRLVSRRAGLQRALATVVSIVSVELRIAHFFAVTAAAGLGCTFCPAKDPE